MTAVSDCFINQNGYNYSKVLKNGVRVSSSLKTEEVLEYGDRTVRTMYDAFCNGLRINGDGNCLGHIWEGSFIWHSYNKVYRILCDFGSGMINSGLKPGAFVGVYSKNCMEWMICEYGCFRYSIVIVPLYDTLGPEICQYCINHTELTTVICDTEEKLNILLDQASSTPSLKKIISICKPSSETLKLAKEKEIDILAFEDILASGSKDPRNPVPPRPEDLAFVMYTSGTTGNPKGVMLSHKNMVAVSGSANAVLEGEHFDKNDIIISFLPLAHSFEQDIEVTAFSSGASVGYTSGVITKLKDDFQLLKPTITPMVPRLLNKIYDSSVSAVEKSFIKKKIFNMAVKQKSKYVKRCIITRNTLWDKLVFSKIQKAFGGRLRILISGSAPLSEDVLFFMRCAFGCIVLEGYGQTENCGASVITAIKDSTTGHVGGPLQCAYMKVVDVPEMDYYAKNEEGEICIKGPHVMMGYYKDGKKTSETIDTDGWLHTGDIGRWLPNGALKIIDRKKHIFKLAQGEYIAPEKIENIYLRSKYVAQVFVHGESLQSCLIGIVVPDQEILESWAKSNKKTGSFQDHCLNIELKKEILQDMNKLGKSAGLHSFELVKDIYLESEPFSIANNMLTAVLKNKRNVMRKHYESHIQEMYLNLA